jgi:PAS domain-containing protein
MDHRAAATEEQRARLATAAAALQRLRPAIEAAAPWPLAERFGHEPEASWGPPEVLAHVGEMLTFWLGESIRVAKSPEQPVPFGRLATDDIRIGLIARERTLPLEALFETVAAGVERWDRRLGRLTVDEAARRGVHATVGEVTVEGLVDRFVLGHFEEHVRQLETIMEDRRQDG